MRSLDCLTAGAVRLYVILDTSVLLTHWSFIQALHRNLGEGGVVAAEPEGGEEGSPPIARGVQMVLVVPWAVLVELDKLKEQRPVLRIKGAVLCCAVLCCAVLCCAVLPVPALRRLTRCMSSHKCMLTFVACPASAYDHHAVLNATWCCRGEKGYCSCGKEGDQGLGKLNESGPLLAVPV